MVDGRTRALHARARSVGSELTDPMRLAIRAAVRQGTPYRPCGTSWTEVFRALVGRGIFKTKTGLDFELTSLGRIVFELFAGTPCSEPCASPARLIAPPILVIDERRVHRVMIADFVRVMVEQRLRPSEALADLEIGECSVIDYINELGPRVREQITKKIMDRNLDEDVDAASERLDDEPRTAQGLAAELTEKQKRRLLRLAEAKHLPWGHAPAVYSKMRGLGIVQPRSVDNGNHVELTELGDAVVDVLRVEAAWNRLTDVEEEALTALCEKRKARRGVARQHVYDALRDAGLIDHMYRVLPLGTSVVAHGKTQGDAL